MIDKQAIKINVQNFILVLPCPEFCLKTYFLKYARERLTKYHKTALLSAVFLAGRRVFCAVKSLGIENVSYDTYAPFQSAGHGAGRRLRGDPRGGFCQLYKLDKSRRIVQLLPLDATRKPAPRLSRVFTFSGHFGAFCP